MYFYLSALSLLYRISDLFSRLNFGSAVFFTVRNELCIQETKKRFLPDEVRVSDTDNKQATKMFGAKRESL